MIYGSRVLEKYSYFTEINIELEVSPLLEFVLLEDGASRNINIRKKDNKNKICIYLGNTEAASRNSSYGTTTKQSHAGRIKIKDKSDSYVIRLTKEKDGVKIGYGVKDEMTAKEKEFFRSKAGKLAKEFVEDYAKELADIYYTDSEKELLDFINSIPDGGKYELLNYKGKKIERIE